MSFKLRVVLASAAAIWLAAMPSAQRSPTGPLALVGGTLIDGTDRAPVRNSVVLLRGERIERVGTVASTPVPSGYEVISTEGMTVLPGLWDPHVHLLYSGHPDLAYWFKAHANDFERITMPASAQQLLAAGVTSARDLGAPLQAALAIRQRIASGELKGPTMYVAGPVLMNGAPAVMTHTISVSGDADARTKTRQLIEAGVNVIKVANAEQMPPGAVAAIVAEAHAGKMWVTAHGRTDGEIRLALAGGVDELQHIGTDSPEYPADILDAIRARVRGGGLKWSLTVGAQLTAPELASDAEYLDSPRNFLGLPASIADEVRKGIASAPPATPAPATERIIRRKVAQLQELGVDLVFGSDVGGFGAPAGEATWRELDVWVRVLGIPPAVAIREATSEAAKLMGAGGNSGAIVAGYVADLIAVRGNPLQHINVVRQPAVVIHRGRRQ
jgi:imidazolonepropionase-like amidohydrolase